MKNKRQRYEIAIIVVLLILISISSFFVFYFYELGKDTFYIDHINVNKRTSINYNVNNKNNEYSNINNEIYIKDLISDINTYYNYTLTFSEDVVGEYSYYVEGNLVFLSNDESELVKKDLYRSSLNSFKIDGKVLDIGSTVNIDFSSYLDIYNKIIKDYDLNNEAIIKFDMCIDYNIYGNSIKKYVKQSEIMSISIPISKDTVKLEIPRKIDDNTSIYSDIKIKDKVYIVICLEFIGVIVLLILIIILILKQGFLSTRKYENVKKRLLKKYNNLIVEVLDIPNMNNLDVLFVKDFKELIDAANQLNLPIIYFEVKENREGVFTVMSNEHAFVYKLR